MLIESMENFLLSFGIGFKNKMVNSRFLNVLELYKSKPKRKILNGVIEEVSSSYYDSLMDIGEEELIKQLAITKAISNDYYNKLKEDCSQYHMLERVRESYLDQLKEGLFK